QQGDSPRAGWRLLVVPGYDWPQAGRSAAQCVGRSARVGSAPAYAARGVVAHHAHGARPPIAVAPPLHRMLHARQGIAARTAPARARCGEERPGWARIISYSVLHQSPPLSPAMKAYSAKRANRNGRASARGVRPSTKSAMNSPAAGPMPNPCPEKPDARKNPGTASTGDITGKASGVTSI